MPFLTPPIDTLKKTQFYVLRSIAPHLGVSFTLQKMAQTFIKQNKKVLIFDTLLGLKNFPLVNKNQDKISAVLAGDPSRRGTSDPRRSRRCRRSARSVRRSAPRRAFSDTGSHSAGTWVRTRWAGPGS